MRAGLSLFLGRLRHPSALSDPQRVTFRVLFLFSVLAALPLASSAQDKGYWRAASSNAEAITGDIALSDTKLTLNYLAYSLIQAKTLTPAEVSAVFDADVNAGVSGLLYHVTVPANRRLLHKNTLCGPEDTQWMATYVSGRTMQVAFFSGATAPTFTLDAISHSTDVCGTFSFAR